jgi:curved DNA-binding protein CbpA
LLPGKVIDIAVWAVHILVFSLIARGIRQSGILERTGMRDPYEVLRVPRSAGADDIKKSFRRLAKALHPDGNKDDLQAPARFAELSSAHEILRDENKRRAFDRGEIDAEGKPVRQPAAHATRRRHFASNLRHVVTCLAIAVLMPIATLPLIIRSLTPQAQINPNADGNKRVLTGFESLEQHASIGQTERPDRGSKLRAHGVAADDSLARDSFNEKVGEFGSQTGQQRSNLLAAVPVDGRGPVVADHAEVPWNAEPGTAAQHRAIRVASVKRHLVRPHTHVRGLRYGPYEVYAGPYEVYFGATSPPAFIQ